jgi:hypothetical protein
MIGRRTWKAETFTPPTEAYRTAPEGNVTWDEDVPGFEGPISSTFPAQFYPGVHSALAAEKALGIPRIRDQGAGAPFGSLFYLSSERPAAGRYVRSYSKNDYFDPIRNRHNIHLLPDTMTRVRSLGIASEAMEKIVQALD